MNVSYKREMKHNYLIIEQEHPEHSYEAKMLVNNVIEGLLKFRIKKVDERCYFCYEITSKQPLSRLLENRSMKLEELQQMVFAMAQMLTHMEEYLLKEGQILLEPEFIYVEPDSFRIGCCLLPGHSGNFPKEFSKLLEYLLGKVDYQDKDCVVMAYALYRESLKENYGMEDLLGFLKNNASVKLKKEEEVKPPEEIEPPEFSNQDAYRQNQLREEPGSSKKDSTTPTIWKRIRSFFKRDKKNSKKSEERTFVEMPWQMVFDEEIPVERKPEIEDESHDTMLLAENENKIQLKRLKSLEADVDDICIAYYPFIIGKQENVVDYILNKDTVSRLHLRIDEVEGKYQITDLNSTNGTSVNGKLLENNEVMSIKTGDEIAIAGVYFCFT